MRPGLKGPAPEHRHQDAAKRLCNLEWPLLARRLDLCPRLLLDDDRRPDPHPIIEVDHVLIGQANASRRNRVANRFRFI